MDNQQNNLEKPVIVQKKSLKMEMEPGIYFWCACGRSNNQPFCDGSHKGTGITPVKVEIDKPRKVAWCMCRYSGKAPFCDGTHREL